MPTLIDEHLWMECQAVCPKFAPKKLPFFCGHIDGNVEVYVVDGDAVKLRKDRKVKSRRDDDDFMDFVEGGNGIEDPGLCGHDQIILDDNVQPHDWPFILYHEAVERRDMIQGMKYDQAHVRANRGERALRQRAQQARSMIANG